MYIGQNKGKNKKQQLIDKYFLFFFRTQTVPNGDGSSRQETITENYSNHETYIENEMIVHTGPELSAVRGFKKCQFFYIN